MNETIGDNLRVISNSLLLVFYGLGGVVVNILAFKFSTYWHFYVAIFLGIVVFSLGFFWMAETPYYCLNKRDYEGFRNSMLYMAKQNRRFSGELANDLDTFIERKRLVDLKNKQ